MRLSMSRKPLPLIIAGTLDILTTGREGPAETLATTHTTTNVWECAAPNAGAGPLFAMTAVIIKVVMNMISVAATRGSRGIACCRFYMSSGVRTMVDTLSASTEALITMSTFS